MSNERIKASEFFYQEGDRVYFKSDHERQMIVKAVSITFGGRVLEGGFDEYGKTIDCMDYEVFSVKINDEGNWIELERD